MNEQETWLSTTNHVIWCDLMCVWFFDCLFIYFVCTLTMWTCGHFNKSANMIMNSQVYSYARIWSKCVNLHRHANNKIVRCDIVKCSTCMNGFCCCFLFLFLFHCTVCKSVRFQFSVNLQSAYNVKTNNKICNGKENSRVKYILQKRMWA